MTAAAAVFVIAGVALLLLLVYAITIDSIKDAFMSETQDAIDAITAQLGKAKGEIVAAVTALDAKITELSAEVAEAVAPDLTALKAVAQSLDDLNPDEDPAAE